MKLYPLLLTLLLCSNLQSADVGMGISWRDGGSTLYVPVDVNTKFRLEGLLGYQKNSQTLNGHNYIFRGTNIGIGAFWVKGLSDSSKMYLGSRFQYSRIVEISTESYGTPSYIPFERKENGFGVIPTLGFEYFPVKNISIGGEAGLSYARKHASVNYQFGGDPGKSYQLSTVTSVVLRMYF